MCVCFFASCCFFFPSEAFQTKFPWQCKTTTFGRCCCCIIRNFLLIQHHNYFGNHNQHLKYVWFLKGEHNVFMEKVNVTHKKVAITFDGWKASIHTKKYNNNNENKEEMSRLRWIEAKFTIGPQETLTAKEKKLHTKTKRKNNNNNNKLNFSF